MQKFAQFVLGYTTGRSLAYYSCATVCINGALIIAHELRHVWQYGTNRELLLRETFVKGLSSEEYRKQRTEQDANGFAAYALYTYYVVTHN